MPFSPSLVLLLSLLAFQGKCACTYDNTCVCIYVASYPSLLFVLFCFGCCYPKLTAKTLIVLCHSDWSEEGFPGSETAATRTTATATMSGHTTSFKSQTPHRLRTSQRVRERALSHHCSSNRNRPSFLATINSSLVARPLL